VIDYTDPALIARFMSKVRKSDDPHGCWEWTAFRNRAGYGRFRVGSHRDGSVRTEVASRVAYRIFVGEIPAGMLTCHSCDRPSCCNPAHLFLGTILDNTADMVSKQRQRGAPGTRNSKAVLADHHIPMIIVRARRGESHRDIARVFGVTPSLASQIVRGVIWAQVPRPPR
jgi:hypothetical protein